MLKPGDLLMNTDDDFLAYVIRHDGAEGCIVRRPNGKEERWNRYVDEQPHGNFHRGEIHTVADLRLALACLPDDAHISVTDGNRSGPPAIYLHKDGARSGTETFDVVSFQAK